MKSRSEGTLLMWMIFSVIAATAAEPTASWPRFGGPSGDFRIAAPADVPAGKLRWRRPLGWGTSGIVADGQRLYTCLSEPTGKTNARESVVALDLADGRELWRKTWDVKFRGKQQTHDEPIQPLSTPLLHAGGLFALSFDGVLRRLDPKVGDIRWSVDLVERFGATPVQYGFAASPVPLGDSVLVAAGGTKTHLVALRAENGEALWQTEKDEPGYGTPVIGELAGRRQAVAMGRDAVCGYDVSDGATLWRLPVKDPGLTNVPTPLLLSKDRVVVSGQGFDGVGCYRIGESAAGFAAKQLWRTPSSQFFYANWVAHEERLYGFDRRFFVGIDLRNGEILWKNRTQTDANVVLLGDRLLALRSDGLLTLGSPTKTGFTAERWTVALPDGRCWTPPTVVGSVIYVRNSKEVAALDLGSLGSAVAPPAAPKESAIDSAIRKWSGK